MIAYLILSPFLFSLIAAWLVSRYRHAATVLAAWPAILAVALWNEFQSTLASGSRVVELPWAPSLGLSLSFNLDGLGLLFALLITTVGALVTLYASRYLAGHAEAGRFYASLFAFMGAMLGVVLSDNILTLFVFWELTGFTSFLLIGFEHERRDARSAALQALIVTGAGGLALLAAGVLLLDASGTTSLAAMASSRDTLLEHPLYAVIATLVLAAAFTKSAQVPFHFWLPNAMAAPTPVSAYLHSATMVKAGVYLVARMTPILGATTLWTTAVTAAGAATMIVGAYRSVQETDLKRILAYSTVSALGVLTMLLGVGTREAINAALVYLVAHAGYKGALFLVAGAIDHETGTRDITRARGPSSRDADHGRGRRRRRVVDGRCAADARFRRQGRHLRGAAPWRRLVAGAITVLASVLLGLAGFLAGVLPFRGTLAGDHAHEPPWPLWMPPLALAVGGVVAGLVPSVLNAPLSAAASVILHAPGAVSMAVWHGLSPPVLLSVLTLGGVAAMYVGRDAVRRRTWHVGTAPRQLYDGALSALNAISRAIGPPLLQRVAAVVRHGDCRGIERHCRGGARVVAQRASPRRRPSTCSCTRSSWSW